MTAVSYGSFYFAAVSSVQVGFPPVSSVVNTESVMHVTDIFRPADPARRCSYITESYMRSLP